MIAVDTNVLVYAVDTAEPVKQTIATDLLRDLYVRKEGILLWQVAAEFLAVLRKWQQSGRITEVEIAGYLTHSRSILSLVLPTEKILGTALDVGKRFSLSHWDSMLIAGCLDAGATILYTEDLSTGQYYDSLQAVNPFVTNP